MKGLAKFGFVYVTLVTVALLCWLAVELYEELR
jgi:apolipoprotein N-acyltransferase